MLLALALVVHLPRIAARESLWLLVPAPAEFGGRWSIAEFAVLVYADGLLSSLFTNLSEAPVIFLVCARLGGRPATFTGSVRGGLHRFVAVLKVSLLLFGLYAFISLGLHFLHFQALRAGWMTVHSIRWVSFLTEVTAMLALCPLWVAVPAAVAEPSQGRLRRSWRLTRKHRSAVCSVLLLLLALDWGTGRLLGVVGSEWSWLVWKAVWWTQDLLIVSLSAVFAAVGYHALRLEKDGVDVSKLEEIFA